MAKVYWHRVQLDCPQCHIAMTILDISCAVDGEILVDGLCVKCGAKLQWVGVYHKLICKALLLDLENNTVDTKKPLKPPLAIPEEKKKDKKWLHDLGIGGDE